MSQKVIIFCVAFLLLLAACAPNVGESAEGGGVSVTAVSIPIVPTPISIAQPTVAPPIEPTVIPTTVFEIEPTVELDADLEIEPEPVAKPTIEPEPTVPETVGEPIADPVNAPLYATESDMVVALEGGWVWQSSTYPFVSEGDPSVETPETTGNHVILMFGADKFVEEYRNGDLVSREAYDILPDPAGSGWLLTIGAESSWVSVNTIELTISTAPLDGPISSYAKLLGDV